MRLQIFGARSIPARWGGFDNTATELATRLAAMGHDVTVYVMPKYALPERPAVYAGVRLRYVPTLYGKYFETPLHEVLSAFLGLWRRADIDYVLGCRTSFAYLPYRLFGRRVVFNTDGLDFKRSKWGPLARAYLRFSYWLASRIGVELIHDNTHIQRYFTEHFGRGGAFITIGGTPFAPRAPTVLARYGVTPGDYYLVACRIEPENNIQNLVAGFLRSRSRRRLVVAGGANYRSAYVRELQRVQDPRVSILGPVYEEGHIEELHGHCFAYLHGHEVGGTNPALLKAMACGNLVIANRTDYNLEVLGAENGVYFENTPEDIARQIDFVEAGFDGAAAMRDRARARVAQYYSWDRSAELHVILFEWLLGRRERYEETF